MDKTKVAKMYWVKKDELMINKVLGLMEKERKRQKKNKYVW